MRMQKRQRELSDRTVSIIIIVATFSAMAIPMFLVFSGLLSLWDCQYKGGEWVERVWPSGVSAGGYCDVAPPVEVRNK